MSWREQLRKASFRGVPFFVSSSDKEFGRRTVTHEYPLRDKPYVEDLGRKVRTVTIEAYVLATAANGLNYMPQRDALIAAIEQAGSGVLSHPYLGEMRASCTESRVRETTAEGGMARFTLTFVESGEVTFPLAQTNTRAVVNTRADEAIVSFEEDFGDNFTVLGKPEFIAAEAAELLGDVTSALQSIAKLIPTNVTFLADLIPNVTALAAEADTLIRTPDTLAGRITSLVGDLSTLSGKPADVLKVLRRLFSYGKSGSAHVAAAVPAGTTTRATQTQNQDATLALVQRASVATAARAASEMEFETYDEAVAVRTELADEMETLMNDASSDEVYASLAALRAATVKDITARGANLNRVVSYTPQATLPALVLSYDLYDDAARDAEIVSRNGVRHPGFVPGGAPLQVVTNA